MWVQEGPPGREGGSCLRVTHSAGSKSTAFEAFMAVSSPTARKDAQKWCPDGGLEGVNVLK